MCTRRIAAAPEKRNISTQILTLNNILEQRILRELWYAFGMIFRDARVDDLEFIYASLQALAAHDGRPDEMKSSKEQLQTAFFAENPVAHALICEKEGTAVGMALWCPRFSAYSGESHLYLIDLYVEKSARGQGIGTQFFEELRNICSSQSLKYIEWLVDEKNENAVIFYKKQGGFSHHYAYWAAEV